MALLLALSGVIPSVVHANMKIVRLNFYLRFNINAAVEIRKPLCTVLLGDVRSAQIR